MAVVSVPGDAARDSIASRCSGRSRASRPLRGKGRAARPAANAKALYGKADNAG